MPSSPSQILLEWQTLDSHPHERGNRWYLIGGIFILLFAVYGILDGSWITAILALLMGGVYFLLRNVQPETITVRITAMGIEAAGELTPWNQMKDFWILVGRDFTELHASPTRLLQTELRVFIRAPKTAAEQAPDPGIVRDILLQFLPERSGMEERMLDTFARVLKL